MIRKATALGSTRVPGGVYGAADTARTDPDIAHNRANQRVWRLVPIFGQFRRIGHNW